MSEVKKIKFAVDGRDEGGEPARVELAVRPPSAEVRSKANVHRLKAYADAVKGGAMIREQLDKHLRDMEIWDDEKERALAELQKIILDAELKIARGGCKKSEAFETSLLLRVTRGELYRLLLIPNRIRQNTADAAADQAYFEYLVAACTTRESGRFEGSPYFTTDGRTYSVSSYLDRSEEADGREAAERMSELLHGKAKEVPEEAFLRKYGYVDDKGRLVDKKGRLIDAFGNLVDEEGYFVDERGDRVDVEGNRVDASGNFLVDFVPFIDDDEEEQEGGEVEDPHPETPTSDLDEEYEAVDASE